MRSRMLTLLALPIAALNLACIQVTAAPVSFHDTRSFPAAPGKLVRLDVRSLDVVVTVIEGGSITATTDLEIRTGSSARAKRWFAQHTPVFEDSATALEIRVPKQLPSVTFSFGSTRTKARISVSVPAGCAVETHTSSGDVVFEGPVQLAPPTRINTASGDVTVRGGMRELIVETASGDVHVSGLHLALFQASTASGDVVLESGSDKALIDTASGDVRLHGLTGDLTVDTASGDVSATWKDLATGHAVKIGTSSGDVSLTLPATVLVTGSLRTHSGDLTSDLPGVRDKRERVFNFAAQGTGVPLAVHTSSGDITIHKQS
jgi:hypothetical protein